MKIKKVATITCPYCNHKRTMEMPTNTCQFSLKCEKCGKMIMSKPEDCCVFCSYADVKCPAKQV